MVSGALLYSVKETRSSIQALSQGELELAQSHAHRAQRIVYPLTFLTAHRVHTLTAWSAALRVPQELTAVMDNLSGLMVQDADHAPTLNTLIDPLHTLLATLTELDR